MNTVYLWFWIASDNDSDDGLGLPENDVSCLPPGNLNVRSVPEHGETYAREGGLSGLLISEVWTSPYGSLEDVSSLPYMKNS